MLQFKDPYKELPAYWQPVLLKYDNRGDILYGMYYLEGYTPVVEKIDGKPPLNKRIKEPCFMKWFGEAEEHICLYGDPFCRVLGWIYTKDLEEILIK